MGGCMSDTGVRMENFVPISPQTLIERRQLLRRQRRLRRFQILWQTVLVTGLTVGAVWAINLPLWVITTPEQIDIQGSERLSPDAIRSLVPLQYPQPLMQVEPHVIAEQLKIQAPITDAVVRRHLFPPRLEVHIWERQPVAVVIPDESAGAAHGAQDAIASQPGLLDDQGMWMAEASFSRLGTADFPALKVRGLRQSFLSYWPAMYASIRQSPVKISEIDWREPNNLILHTELGIVHLGAYGEQFPTQLAALGKMRNLNSYLPNQEIAYIDLNNPNTPLVQTLETHKDKPPQTP